MRTVLPTASPSLPKTFSAATRSSTTFLVSPLTSDCERSDPVEATNPMTVKYSGLHPMMRASNCFSAEPRRSEAELIPVTNS